jgi:type II secretion system protein D
MKTTKSDSRVGIVTTSPVPGAPLSMWVVVVGLISAIGIVATAWVLGGTPFLANTTPLSAASKPKNDPDESKSSEKTRAVKLNYFSASWQRVFQDMCDAFELEFVGDSLPRGRFSRMDKAEYSLKDAMRIINKEIEPQGLRLIEKAQFLILLDIASTRKEYPPAVLPRKEPPKPLNEVEEETEAPRRFSAEKITKKREGGVDRADYRETASDKSDRSRAVRKSTGSNSIRQASLEEAENDSRLSRDRRNNPFGDGVPAALEDVGATAQHVVYRARNLRAVDLSKRIYRALKADAELLDAGRDGLPAFRVVNPQFQSHDSESPKNGTLRPIEFMISIDEHRNELLIDGGSKDVNGVLKLLRIIDRPAEEEVQTQIKPSTKYVCQIADQLPAELERIRAAGGSKAIAKVPVDGKPLWVADENQRAVPASNDDDEEPTTRRAEESESAIDGALGNFKGEVNIEVIEDLNVMIVRGNERDVAQIMKVIQQIERLSEATAPQVHLLRLNNVDAESLAELLTSVYEKLTKFPGRATQPRESVAIIPVTKPNSLLIVAPEADLETILDLADQLDQPVDPQTEFEVFRLKSAPASDVETLITEFYKERKSLGAKVLVIADPRSNSIIVRARPRDLDEIKALIKKVDRDEVGAVNQVKIFTLKNAIASEIAAVINSAIQSVLSAPRSSGGGGGGGGQGGNSGLGGGQVEEQFKSAKSAVLQFLATDKGNSRQVRSGILSDIRVTPDAHTNTLIVTASEKSMDLISALIQTLDRPTTTVSVIKVFTLANADASQMVQQLNALFNNQPQGAGANQANRPLLGIALANADDASSSLVPLKFSVDTRTNSVIAVGSSDAMSVVEAVLTRLDESNLRTRKNTVVRLNNAPAPVIATAVTTFFQQQRDLVQNDPNLVSNVEQLERDVIVIPDTVSNNLLVSATPRYYPDIMQMIKTLDMEPKQVVIQALIVEVQLNNTDEFGIELGLQSPVLFDRSLLQTPTSYATTNIIGGGSGVTTTTLNVLSTEATPGFNFNNPSVPLGNNVYSNATGIPAAAPGVVGGQSLTNFSLGRVNSQLGYGGLVLSAGSNSVNALLRALSSQTKIQILSRPTIRALDNQQADVFVGRTIPTVTNFIPNATTGVLTPTLQQRETGIGMTVTPRINMDGNVVISLYAYRSQLSNDYINVTTDSRGQPINQRITDLSHVRSTVLVPANNTIVIGGMISSRDETQVRKAPFLADIPILGHLFRYDTRSTVRSELLIFLTPRIVNGPDEEECLKEIEMGRLHFIESEAEKAHGPLRAVPAADPDSVFVDESPNWIAPGGPSVPPTPIDQPGMVAPQESTPTRLPPPAPPAPMSQPTAPSSETPSAPPLPDESVTQINALRMKATEENDSKNEGVTTANWVAPSKTKKRNVKSKPTSESEK